MFDTSFRYRAHASPKLLVTGTQLRDRHYRCIYHVKNVHAPCHGWVMKGPPTQTLLVPKQQLEESVP